MKYMLCFRELNSFLGIQKRGNIMNELGGELEVRYFKTRPREVKSGGKVTISWEVVGIKGAFTDYVLIKPVDNGVHRRPIGSLEINITGEPGEVIQLELEAISEDRRHTANATTEVTVKAETKPKEKKGQNKSSEKWVIELYAALNGQDASRDDVIQALIELGRKNANAAQFFISNNMVAGKIVRTEPIPDSRKSRLIWNREHSIVVKAHEEYKRKTSS